MTAEQIQSLVAAAVQSALSAIPTTADPQSDQIVPKQYRRVGEPKPTAVRPVKNRQAVLDRLQDAADNGQLPEILIGDRPFVLQISNGSYDPAKSVVLTANGKLSIDGIDYQVGINLSAVGSKNWQ